MHSLSAQEVRRSSSGRVSTCEAFHHPIVPAEWIHFQPVVHNWSIKGCDICCLVCGKVHIKDPLLLLLIGKGSLCGDSGFPLKKYVTMTIYIHA